MSTQNHTFQAEVRQLLDIVINSLYTDREIFIRELVSNASDAMEKLRHLQLTENTITDAGLPLQISITTNEEGKTLTIKDHGIGMTREELIQNLGTIAHSGTRAFLQSLKEGDRAAGNVIGRFGVGFYSCFMAAKQVKVYTRSWRADSEALCWTSDGQGGYSIDEATDVQRGTKIVMELKDDAHDYAQKWKVSEVLKRYSNFVPFPVELNGERENKVEALWLKKKSEVKDEEYEEFYKFIAHAWDEPRYRLHFNADAPLAIASILFVPQENPEKFGMGQVDPGVALYCRRVLIDPHPKGLVPDWMRFVKGVIDSDDLPLNISRETMQDSALVRKLGEVMTSRFIRNLESEAEESPDKYKEFHAQFSRFIKEGIATDYSHRESLAKLLRFESSMTEKGELTSFDDYLKRAKEEQKDIYYIIAPSRESIESGPYLEAFKARGLEVIYFFDPVDDYVCSSLREFSGKKLVSADRSDLELGDAPKPEGEPLPASEADALCSWLQDTLGSGVEKVQTGNRLVTSPAVALTPEDGMNPQMRAMMKAMNQDVGASKVVLEINASSPMIRHLNSVRTAQPELAKVVAAQVMDNALLAAGLLDDPRRMVDRLNGLLGQLLEKSTG